MFARLLIRAGLVCAAAILTATLCDAFTLDNLVNNRTGAPFGSSDYSPSVAAIGDTVLVIWSQKTTAASLTTIQSAMSFDGGVTFTQLGSPPLPAGWAWYADGRAVADPLSHTFYVAARVRGTFAVTNAYGGIGFLSGAPATGATMLWGTPKIVDLLATVQPVQWLDGDDFDLARRSYDGRLAIIYDTIGTDALGFSLPDSVLVRASADAGGTWTPRAVLTSAAVDGLMNPRVSFGSNGSITAAWQDQGALNTSERSSVSVDGGLTFSPAGLIHDGFSLFGDIPGGPVLSRSNLALASDPTYAFDTPRDVAIWSESFDAATAAFPDPTTTPNVADLEPSDSTLIAAIFAPGAILRGQFDPTAATDIDFFQFAATAGVRYVFLADSGGSVADPTTIQYEMYIVGPDGKAWLTSTGASPKMGSPATYTHFGFTPAISGTYYLRVSNQLSPSYALSQGSYRIRTATDTRAPTTGRDQRDLFISLFNPEQGGWSAPLPVVDTEPAGFDDNGPSMSFAADGFLYVGSYDWQKFPGRAVSRFRLARALGAGAIWDATAIASSFSTDWMNVASVRPTFRSGRITSVVSSRNLLYAAWTDGRFGDPDIMIRRMRTDLDTVSCPGDRTVGPGQTIDMMSTLLNHNDLFTNRISYTNTLGRYWPPYVQTSYFDVIGATTADDIFTVQVPDTAAAGVVTVHRAFSNGSVCDCKLTVDRALATVGTPSVDLALSPVSPNPTFGSTRLEFSLPHPAWARIDILDAGGRRVRTLASGLRSSGTQNVVWDARDEAGRTLPPGLFWVRMRVDGRSLTRRFVLLR